MTLDELIEKHGTPTFMIGIGYVRDFWEEHGEPLKEANANLEAVVASLRKKLDQYENPEKHERYVVASSTEEKGLVNAFIDRRTYKTKGPATKVARDYSYLYKRHFFVLPKSEFDKFEGKPYP